MRLPKSSQWKIIRETERGCRGERQLIVKCVCGNVFKKNYFNIVSGLSKRCKPCSAKRLKFLKKTHGKSHSKIYRIYVSMVDRCEKKNHKDFSNYGGRGIKVLWKRFEDFYRDMGDPPNGMELDRINNNGNYSKKNCRWVTHSENMRNTRNNRIIRVNGEDLCLTAAIQKYKISKKTFYDRIKKGFSEEMAILGSTTS